ncbi:uncharacterized protein EI90DRAFT_3015035 [Cantharellus anzutake]|uniref:uncharacterized protein n=1 Tax=Cantharellus anzutake TaxID=1750568 RepID=UPI0019047848|nr:uncharacterized protein EI90DRAFT_3015035 [Cantharellus anzutake]KAF8333949.1 hypothetical protein EI90DRAFT_3015035 [Cantharellus anzutake]
MAIFPDKRPDRVCGRRFGKDMIRSPFWQGRSNFLAVLELQLLSTGLLTMLELKWIPVHDLTREESKRQKVLHERLIRDHGPFPLLWDFNVPAVIQRLEEASQGSSKGRVLRVSRKENPMCFHSREDIRAAIETRRQPVAGPCPPAPRSMDDACSTTPPPYDGRPVMWSIIDQVPIMTLMTCTFRPFAVGDQTLMAQSARPSPQEEPPFHTLLRPLATIVIIRGTENDLGVPWLKRESSVRLFSVSVSRSNKVVGQGDEPLNPGG